MRVLFVSHYAMPHVSGIEVVVDTLARELAARGHEVVHVASDAGAKGEGPPLAAAPAPRRVAPAAVASATRRVAPAAVASATRRDAPAAAAPAPRRVLVPAANTLEERLEVPYPVFSPALLGVLRREVLRADVVHGHGFLYQSTVAALLWARGRAARGGRVARVLTEHVGHVDYANPVLDRVERAAIATLGRACVRAAQATVVLNDAVGDQVRALGGRVEVIFNGVDEALYRPAESAEARAALRARLGWDDDRPRVLFVGRMVGKKGLDLALAAQAAAGGAWELVVVGPGAFPGPVPEGVSVLGMVQRERLAEMYRAADAFLLPSHGEGFPLSAQEALASSLPVFLREDPRYEPYVEGAGPGLSLVPPDPPAIAAAVTALVTDPDRLAAARTAALDHARRRFSLARTVDEHERLYRELLASS